MYVHVGVPCLAMDEIPESASILIDFPPAGNDSKFFTVFVRLAGSTDDFEQIARVPSTIPRFVLGGVMAGQNYEIIVKETGDGTPRDVLQFEATPSGKNHFHEKGKGRYIRHFF